MPYLRLLDRLQQPQMLKQSKLELISKALLPTLLTGEKLHSTTAGKELQTERELQLEGYYVVNVHDTLVSRPSFLNSGETVYGDIVKDVKQGVQEGHTAFLFDINSTGGEVAKCFSTCRELIDLKMQQGLTFLSVVNEQACSAAYAIASIADQIYAVQGAEQGSIGVISIRLSQNKYDEQAGLEYYIFRSKEGKALGSPHESISDKEIEQVKKDLTIIDNEFNLYISTQRNISVESIITMQGQSFFTEKALELNLIDSIIPYLAIEFLPTFTRHSMSESVVQNTDEQMQEAVKTAMIAERRRILSIQAIGHELNIPETSISRMIETGVEFETAKETFGVIREAVEATNTVTMAQKPTTPQRESLATRVGLTA